MEQWKFLDQASTLIPANVSKIRNERTEYDQENSQQNHIAAPSSQEFSRRVDSPDSTFDLLGDEEKPREAHNYSGSV